MTQLPSLLKDVPAAPQTTESGEFSVAPTIRALPDTKKRLRALEWVAAVGRCVERGVTFDVPEPHLQAEMRGHVEAILGIADHLKEVDEIVKSYHEQAAKDARNIEALRSQVNTLQQSLNELRAQARKPKTEHRHERNGQEREVQAHYDHDLAGERTDLEPDLRELRLRRVRKEPGTRPQETDPFHGLTDDEIWNL